MKMGDVEMSEKCPSIAVVTLATVFAVSIGNASAHAREPSLPELSFFEDCALVSVDIQPGIKHTMAPEAVPRGWRELGADADDVNNAIAYTFDVAHPNAARVVNSCRQLELPLIFVHWGYQFRDGVDLDPAVRKTFLAQFGTDYAKWPHHISRRDSKPAEILGVQPCDYVIAKTAQDAFLSSNLRFVLENLKIKHIVFVGGHTGACLGRTASSAKRLGYKILCVEDATFAAWQSRKAADLKATGYDYSLATEQFQDMVRTGRNTNGPAGKPGR